MSTEVWRRPTRTAVRQGSASYVLEEDLCPSTEDSHDCTTRSNIKVHGSTDGPWIKYAASRSHPLDLPRSFEAWWLLEWLSKEDMVRPAD